MRTSTLCGRTVTQRGQKDELVSSLRKTFPGLLTILFLIDHVSAGPGTTPNLKHIVIGRCYDYITLVKPSSRYNCEDIWREFEEAVVRRSPCSVRVKDYQRMFRATSQTLPCDKVSFSAEAQTLCSQCESVFQRTAINRNLNILPVQ
ncbi:hypothetical protein SRHO_G00275790 [Serrasalmus rhombeus]